MRFTAEDLKAKGYDIKNNSAAKRLPKPQPSDRPKPLCVEQPQKEGVKDAQQLDAPKSRVRVTLESYACHPLDHDNLAGGCKAAIDALRYEGLLQEDDPANMELFLKSYRVRERQHERLEITLEIGVD